MIDLIKIEGAVNMTLENESACSLRQWLRNERNNKAERFRKKMLKYKRRLKKYGLKESENSNLYAFRSHGAPCSCWTCKGRKYKRTVKHKRLTI